MLPVIRPEYPLPLDPATLAGSFDRLGRITAPHATDAILLGVMIPDDSAHNFYALDLRCLEEHEEHAFAAQLTRLTR